MSGPELDALLTREDTPWRPSMAFFADLSERLDAVDAEIEAEREHIPLEGARADTSVLFSLAALDGGRAPATSARSRPVEPSGVIDLARLEAGVPDPVDSGPLAVGQAAALARRARRTSLLLAAAGVILAAGAALTLGGGHAPRADGVEVEAVQAPPALTATATTPAPTTAAASPGAAGAATSSSAAGVLTTAQGAAGVLADAPASSALSVCLAAPGAPAAAKITWLAGHPDASALGGGTLADPVRACLVAAARALAPRPDPLVVTAPR